MNTNQPIIIVHMRKGIEFSKAHLPKVININLSKFLMKINKFENRSKPIITYCHRGNRGEIAKNIYRKTALQMLLMGSIYNLNKV